MTEISSSLEELIHLTKEKLSHLEAILDITRKQAEAINEGNTDMLNQYIQEKQHHIETIDQLDDRFQKVYGDVRAELQRDDYLQDDSPRGQLYGMLKEHIKGVQDIVGEIHGVERQNNEKVLGFMEELKGKIRNISAAKKGYHAYKNSPAMADGVFIDKKK